MRRLAQALGVEAMTLYHYVANKDDLLAAIVDIVVRAIELPDPAGDWKGELRKAAVSAHAVIGRHPWSARLMLSSDAVLTGRMRYMDAILGTLREAGFSARLTDHAYHSLDSHVLGFSLWVAAIQPDPDQLADRASDVLATLPREEYPWLVEHIEGHLAPDDGGSSFEFGLDLILDGLERLLAADGRAGNRRPRAGT
jgi:AcrR family transcriptional regulator